MILTYDEAFLQKVFSALSSELLSQKSSIVDVWQDPIYASLITGEFLDNKSNARVIKEKIAVTILEYTHVFAMASR